MKTQIIITMAMAALLAGCSDNKYGSTTARDAKVAQQFADLPAAAQAAVKREVPNGVVDKVSAETRDNRMVYKVKFQDEGVNPAIWVTADGNILKSDINKDKAVGATGNASEINSGSSKSNVKFTQLPAAVQKTVRDQAPNAKITDIHKDTKDGQIVYDISFEAKGKNPKIRVTEDGTLAQDFK